MTTADWTDWHQRYETVGSPLAGRLRLVRGHIAAAFDEATAGPIRVVSACAGDGRDLLGVLEDHPRRDDVTGRLVELDPRLAGAGRDAAPAGIEVVTGDASVADAYAGAVPADVVLLCGIFGNVSDDDIRRTVGFAPQLCAPGATVIWTRHRRDPDLTPSIRGWFAEAGFDEIAFHAPPGTFTGVGVCRYAGPPVPLEPGVRIFEFTGTADRAIGAEHS